MLKKSKLELKTLSDGTVIPSIEGLIFCSARDPLKEARKWLESVRNSCRGQKEVVVLGLGAGFHVLALLKMGLQVSVFEARKELIEGWPLKDSVSFIDQNQMTDAIVLEFRPAWTGSEAMYLEASKRLRGVQVGSLRNHAEEKGMWILSQALEISDLPDGLEISIKEIVEIIPKENQTEEARLWRALREMVS